MQGGEVEMIPDSRTVCGAFARLALFRLRQQQEEIFPRNSQRERMMALPLFVVD